MPNLSAQFLPSHIPRGPENRFPPAVSSHQTAFPPHIPAEITPLHDIRGRWPAAMPVLARGCGERISSGWFCQFGASFWATASESKRRCEGTVLDRLDSAWWLTCEAHCRNDSYPIELK